MTKVADQAFANCTSLEEISIPGTVTEIGTTCTSERYLPFYKCTSLIKVKFEDGVQSISLGVFFPPLNLIAHIVLKDFLLIVLCKKFI